MTSGATIWRMFSSLRVPNYRLFLGGQTISMSGTWMQAIAQAWLVLDLTRSGTALGLVSSLQFLPVLLFGPFGGVIADRFDKRRVLYGTQAVAAFLAATLGLVVFLGVVEVWMIYILATGLGFVHVVDHPTRQTFILEMVESKDLTNAVSLNSVLGNVARIIGPALAGALIITVGLAPCFFINAGSYAAVFLALFLMDPDRLHPTERQSRRQGQLRDGHRYVRATPELLVPLVVGAVVGTLTWEYQVVLPLLARFTFDGDASTYSTMTVLMGCGAVVGGLATAAGGWRPATAFARTAIILGAIQLATSLAPTLFTTFVMLVLLGAASIRFLALGNATLQMAVAPEMRGRVMALWTVAFLGSIPIGAPIMGWVGEHFGPRLALGIGGAVALACGALAYPALARVATRATGELPPLPQPRTPA